MTEVETRLLRLAAQRLIKPASSVPDVVRHLVGLQAQDRRMARLLVRPRSAGLDVAAVDRACNDERSVVRTWAMRGTLHMVAATDVRWLVELIGPVSAARSRRRRLELGLDDAVCERGVDAIARVLAGGRALTRAELIREIEPNGVSLDRHSQAAAHLVAYAAHRAVICCGPDLDGDAPTYVLLADWAGDQPPRTREDALRELATRYLAGYGPASVADFAAWSGLPVPEARRGFENAAARGSSGAIPRPGAADRPHVLLLGHFDPYLLGYRDRAFALEERFASRVQRGGGFIQPTVVVDGRVIGTWHQHRAGGRLTITVEPFEALDAAATTGVEAEVGDVGRYLGLEATLEL